VEIKTETYFHIIRRWEAYLQPSWGRRQVILFDGGHAGKFLLLLFIGIVMQLL
jgi:hypothetical protein